jgi:O-6-methylguanine DNA methyltransferase
VAGKEIHTIYCWKIVADRLHLCLASSEKGAMRVGLLLDRDPDCLAYFNGAFPGCRLINDERMNAPLIEAVKSALAGRPVPDQLNLDIRHTAFQMKVWRTIQKIPSGETRTYGEAAAMAGCPKGARAIGQAMHRNPLPIVFPCHRVVAANGLGGFSGGPGLKRYLLERE